MEPIKNIEMKGKVLSIICALGILTVSCSDFLDSKSQDEVIPKTTKDFRELLLGSGYPNPTNEHPVAITSYMDDDLDCDVNNSSAGADTPRVSLRFTRGSPMRRGTSRRL